MELQIDRNLQLDTKLLRKYGVANRSMCQTKQEINLILLPSSFK